MTSPGDWALTSTLTTESSFTSVNMNAVIIYGTAWKKERTTKLVVSAVLNGFRAIDTACQLKHYREDLVGEALTILQEKHEIKREDLFLQTKFTSLGGQDRSQFIPYDPSAPVTDQVQSSFTTSLRNLRTSYLDSYILHSPLETRARTLDAWKTLIALREAGKVRAIGVSNTYNVEELEALEQATGQRVQVVQNRWFQGNSWDQEVYQYCKKHGIQYQSFWTLTGSPVLLNHPHVRSLAATHDLTPEQTVYRIAQLRGITPLCGSTSDTHMREALSAEQVDFSGSGAILAEIDRILG